MGASVVLHEEFRKSFMEDITLALVVEMDYENWMRVAF